MKPIFIMSPLPRSGTTALQRVFNAHPGVTIWGETRWPQLFQEGLSWNATGDENRARFLNGERNFWTAIMCPQRQALLQAMRTFLVSTHAVSGRWGIKMVRGDIETVRLLARLFPASRFVFLIRNCDDCIKSIKKQRWTGHPDNYRLLKSRWRQNASDFRYFVQQNPQTSIRLDYEDLQKEEAVSSVFKKCDIRFDVRLYLEAISQRIGASA